MAKSKGLRYWKKKAWFEFSRYIRIRDAIKTTQTKEWAICCTCNKTFPAFGGGKYSMQAGHFIPGRGNAILFDEDGVHGQCYQCNCLKKGMWPEYMEFMLREHSQDVIDELLALNKTVKKYTPIELEELKDKYKQMYEQLL